jgi:hypothetical protein
MILSPERDAHVVALSAAIPSWAVLEAAVHDNGRLDPCKSEFGFC